jgi:signal transduction histidine kinase
VRSANPRSLIRSPGGLFTLLAGLTTAAALTFAWVGWEMLRQDRAAEASNERDRLDARVERAVQALDRSLGQAERSLAAEVSSPAPDEDALPTGGLVVVLDRSGVRPVRAGTLLFRPAGPSRAKHSLELFAASERTEFLDHDPLRVAPVYRELARSREPDVRAAALMGLARMLRQAHQNDGALLAYREMAALGDVPVIGLPAELVARDAQTRVLIELQRVDDARALATTIQRDLRSSRWILTRGQYEHYFANAAAITGEAANNDDRGALSAAAAVAAFWDAWQAQPSPQGRSLAGDESARQVIVWSGTVDRIAAWTIAPDDLLRRLPAAVSSGIVITDSAGATSQSGNAAIRVVRTAADTGLPFAVQVVSERADINPRIVTRGRIVVAGLGAIVLVLIAGAYFIGRAVKQETSFARLQADFVAAVSHEFRTPLASMRQLSELLAAGRVVSEEHRQHYYESLAGESRRLQRLVENLLDFGKLDAGARSYCFEPLDAQMLAESAVEDFQTQIGRSRCRIDVDAPHGPATVLGDREAITLALHNLIDNAVKYSGGKLVRVSSAPNGDTVAFSVEDEGPGVPEGDRHRIFEKFVRGASAAATGVKGAGVGLAIVRLIASAHGGDVRVASEPGRGSMFTITLRRAASDQPAIRVPSHDAHSNR